MDNLKPLSKQEERVLRQARGGLTDKEIASEMGVSLETVRTYWQRIRKKVGAGTRAEIVARLSEKSIRAIQTEKLQLETEIENRIAMERRLRASEQQWRLMADAMPQIVFVADGRGKARFFNLRFYDYTGLTRDHALKGAWMRIIHREDLRIVGNELTIRSLKTMSAEIEIRIRRADGEYRWHLCRSLPVRDEAGQVRQWIGTATDIHDVVTLRRQLEQDRQKLDQAQQIAKLGHFEYDPETDKVRWSESLFHLFERKTRQGWFNAKPFSPTIHPEDENRVMAAFEKTLKCDVRFDETYRIVLGSGTIRWIHVVATMFELESGQRVLNGTIHDLTEHERRTAQMEFAEASAGTGSFFVDYETNTVEWSRNLFKLVDQPIEAGGMLGTDLSKRMHPEDAERFLASIAKVRAGAEDLDEIARFPTESGYKHLHIRVYRTFRDGKVVASHGFVRDLSRDPYLASPSIMQFLSSPDLTVT